MLYRIFQKKTWFGKTSFKCELMLHPKYDTMICLYENFRTLDEAIEWAESMIEKYTSRKPRLTETPYGIGEME